ncbi:methionine aminotransferase [Acinetobacter nectaris]|uniref:methionine aminotransferase n=1 Tax=Acinetobacter nectaris TaxID=1219382 RepID=UPI001F006D87|nr:methionine aminotransferase [Acinetobacter nectaris]MCF9046124.1 aminotransferase class I/II-fold pyridoxal phosphate-dependent enzyme [Acinetobacter nectaris]
MQIPNTKLPNQGTTIFSVMSHLAQRLNALNLSQGFPDFSAPPQLLEDLAQATLAGYNQYPAGDGLLSLREQVSEIFYQRDQTPLDPITDITITAGATIALHSAIQAFVHAGDEVIIFDPSYDSYSPAVLLAQGIPKHITLDAPSFHVDWQRVKDSITAKTRMIIVNTPHNPTGAIWSKEDWQTLIELIQDTNIIVLSDEVYEHIIFDEKHHYSALSFAALRDRSLVVGSFGKTFHVTGWKTGYCVGSSDLMKQFRQVYQFACFCGVSPVQIALSKFIEHTPEHITNLASFYQNKRDYVLNGLKDSAFELQATQGTYFQLLDYHNIRPDLSDHEMCQYLAEQYKIVTIPLSAFYKEAPQSLKLLRLCFAKKQTTLEQAVHILNQVK